jgi:heme-binding protein
LIAVVCEVLVFANRKELSVKTSSASLRRRLLGVSIVAALPAATIAVLVVPSATAAPNPCAASEVAKTVSSVAKSTGDYLDSHPDTNQAMTTALEQPAGPQSVVSLKNYFQANPKVASDLQTISQPLTGLSTQCKLPLTIPQALSLLQAAQGAGGLPGLPGGAAGALPVAGPQGSQPVGVAPAAPPAATGPLPGPAQTPTTAVR